MIVITLAGDSSRFFNEGFTIVKYKLPFQEKTVIEQILGYLPREQKLLIVLNRKFNDSEYFNNLLAAMGFKNYQVVETGNTGGQFETVLKGLEASQGFWNMEESVTVFNGDTIRQSEEWNFAGCDGFIEVFEAEGTHWSFVDSLERVTKVTEKERISSYCSSGLYFFRSIRMIIENKDQYLAAATRETFVAPFYNFLIAAGYHITSGLVNKNVFIFCGTPAEYQQSIHSYPINKTN